MAVTSLYSILKEYTQKAGSAYVEKQIFIDTLIVTARYKSRKYPAWKEWLIRPYEKFEIELENLVSENLVSVENTEKGVCIFVPAFYTECVRKAWASVSENPETPFPDRVTIKEEIPDGNIRTIDFKAEFREIIENQNSRDFKIINVIFPDKCGSMITLESIISTRALNAAIQKIGCFMEKENNKSELFCKVTSNLNNLSNQADVLFNSILLNPYECEVKIKEADTDSFLIWMSLCKLMREMLAKNKNPANFDIAVLQGLYIIEAFSMFYRDKAIENNEEMQLDQIFDEYFHKVPYIYTLKEIFGFSKENEEILLERFSREIIVAAIKKKTSITPESIYLPDIISFMDSNNEKWFVLKCRVYHAFDIIRSDGRPVIRRVLIKKWHNTIKSYQEIPAMKSQVDFEKYVLDIANEECPVLAAIYNDNKFLIAKEELRFDTESLNIADSFFQGRILYPLSKILNLNRGDIIKTIKASLPFWYSIPLLTGIIRFFRRITGK